MTSVQWLRAVDCPLLQPAGTDADPAALRLVQHLLEVALLRHASDELAPALLQEVASALRADHAGVWEATPSWELRWHHSRPGTRTNLDALPRPLFNEVLDRQAAVIQPPGGAQPAL